MKKILIVALLACIAINATCQDAYINNSGDTIHGKVTNYGEWVNSPPVVNFTDNSGTEIKLTPLTCRGFLVGNQDRYISFSGNRVLNTENALVVHGLVSSVLSTAHIDAFLRQVYSDKGFTLYKYKDAIRTNFYLDKNGTLKELEYYEYLDDDSHSHTYDAYKNYILTQLKDVDAPGKENKIERLTYTEDALVSLFAQVLNDKAHVKEKNRNKYATKYFAGIGVQSDFGMLDDHHGNKGNKTSIAPCLEIGARIPAQRRFGKLFFQPSLFFRALNNTVIDDKNNSFKNQTSIVTLRLGPGYDIINKSGVQVYASFVAGVDFLFGYKSTFTRGTYSNTIKSGATLTKLTLIPEIGVSIQHKLNVAVQGILPYYLPVYSYYYNFNYNYAYKVPAVALMVRYIF